MAKSNKSKVNKKITKTVKKNPAAVIVAVILIVIIIAGLYFAYTYVPSFKTWVDETFHIGGDNGPGEGPGLVNSDGELLVTYIDVGQGDSILIQFPDGKNMIIDGGDTDSKYAQSVNGVLDGYGIKKLDYVLLTHTDADHCGSLDDALKNTNITEVQNVYLPKVKSKDYDLGLDGNYLAKTTTAYNNFVKAAKESTYKNDAGEIVPAELIFTEDVITIASSDNTYKFTMYCRDDDYYRNLKDSAHPLNDVSPICLLEFNGKKMLFTGDVNSSEDKNTSHEKAWMDYLKANEKTECDIDVLKVAHHGGQDSTGADFLSFVKPEYAVVCVGGTQNETKEHYNLYIDKEFSVPADYTIYGNGSYGHPNEAVCAENGRLAAAGVDHVYYTWFNGTVNCKIDKDGNITFSSEKTAKLSGSSVTFE